MAIKPLNSVAGFSVGEFPYTTVIQSNGDINTSNITATGVTNLNTISNVKVSGGTTGQVITTDGAGNLSFTTISTDSISNGTSNIKVYNSGNIALSSAGTANVLVVTSTGANIAGTLNATGNANFENVGATGGYFTTVSGTLTTAAQPNITSVGTLSSLSVAGNISAGGVKTDNLYYANGTPWDMSLPAGSNTQIQYNDGAGGFGASANFTFDSATNTLGVNGNANITSGNLYVGNRTNVSNSAIYVGDIATFTAAYTAMNATSFRADIGDNYSTLEANTGLSTYQSSTGFYGEYAPYYMKVGNDLSGTTYFRANADGNVVATGTITADQFVSNVATGTAPFSVNSTTRVANLNVANAGYADTAGTAGSATTAGTVTTNAQPNITSVGTLTSLGVNGNITATNITANTGVFTGNGSGLTNLTGANVTGEVAYAAVANSVAGANVSGQVSYAAVANSVAGANVSGQVANALVAGTVYTNAQPNITSVGTLTSLDVSGNATAGNVYANSGTIGATTITASGNISAANAVITGNITANHVISTNGISITNGPLTISAGNLDVTGNINVTGNLNYSNVTDLVVGDPLIYIGANNTGDLYDLGIVGSYNDGTYQHTGIARDHNTDTWTFFDGLTTEPTTVIDWANATYPTVKMGNLVTTGNANITGIANVTGNIVAANIYANSGTIGASLLTGTLTTSTQPNITSVGTLNSLSVTGDGTFGNVYANSGIIGAQTLKGEGGNISNIQGANVSGAVSSATTASTAGTVTTNAQPNITSVGTLTSLDVSGNVSVGNVTGTTGKFTTANISGNVILGNTSVTTAVSWASVTTTSISANQDIASFTVAGITGVEFLIKGTDATGSKYSVATVQAVTDGTNVDYTTYGGVNLGGFTGTFNVAVSAGSLKLQVTPASSNSTVWTTQYRFI